MLEKDYEKRITAEQALHHDWVKMYAGADRVSKKALTKLRSFKEATKLKQTILLFLVN